jgi:putative ABC transport system permease protein
MFRHYLTSVLRSLARNKLYAAINIIGLAVGFAAAILVGLYVRDELTYDKWIPGAENVYVGFIVADLPGRPKFMTDGLPGDFAAALKIDIPAIADTARIEPAVRSFRHGAVEANERLYFADANLFAILKPPVIAGNLATALRRPDGIVITRKMARKYFGSDDAIGKTIEIDRAHTMQVTAVLKDFPSNTNLVAEIFVPGHAVFSQLAYEDAHFKKEGFTLNSSTLLRLIPGAKADDVARALPAFFHCHRQIDPDKKVNLEIVPLTDRHLRPTTIGNMARSADKSTVCALGVIGILILLIAIINFVNLMTARASRRAMEVGIRKATGASRGDLIVQFVGEAMMYVMFSMVLSFALIELLLPSLNAFLARNIVFDYWREPWMLIGLAGLVLAVGLVAGAYPAFVLSAFQPVHVLKASMAKTGGRHGLREALVVLQFAILIGLIVAAGVVYRQMQFAQNEALRLDKDQVLLVEGPCHTALSDTIRTLPGVRGLVCSSPNALNFGQICNDARRPGGQKTLLCSAQVDYGFFEFYGLKALAGRFFSEKHGMDAGSNDPNAPRQPSIIVNESAARKLGFASAQAAVGKTVLTEGPSSDRPQSSEIIGVVPDFSLKSIRDPVNATAYYVNTNGNQYLNVRLTGQHVPETLAAIDRAWRQSGQPKPITRKFLDRYVQGLYLDVIRQGQIFALFAVLAVLIACLGMFGLSAFTAEQRTKEIGIRKAMGAETGDILRLLLWQFARPVLWANVIAWPVAGYLMWRWLQGFAYRIELPLWLFPAASVLALGIALLTVLLHSWLVACARPVTALRYE